MWLLIRKHPQGWVGVFLLPSLRHISDGTAAGNLFTPPFTHIKPSARRDATGQDATGHMTAVKEAPPTAMRRQSDRLSVAFTPNPAERRRGRGRGRGRGGGSASWEGRGDGTSFTTVTFVRNHGGGLDRSCEPAGETRDVQELRDETEKTVACKADCCQFQFPPTTLPVNSP